MSAARAALEVAAHEPNTADKGNSGALSVTEVNGEARVHAMGT
jgi:hypothetical protein